MAEQYPTPTVINTAVPTPTATDVYSTANINQATTTPVQAPNLSDPYGLYDQYMKSPDIVAAQQQAAQTQQAINASQQALRSTTTALQNQNQGAMGTTGASVNLIGRQVGRARDLTSNELAALGENLQGQQAYLNTLTTDASNRYQIAQQERAQLQDLIRQTGGKAKISYADSYEEAIKKASKYMEEQAEEENKKAYKDELKAQLRALGKSTKGLSRNELEKKLKKYNKQALEEAKKVTDLDYQIKLKELNKPYYKPESGGSTTEALIQEGTQGIESFFSNVRGNDGYVSPQDWVEAKSQWAKNNLSTASFNAIFGKWRNPNDKYQ